MNDIWTALVSPEGFIPHGFCLTWTPSLLASIVITNAFLALAYAIIMMSLLVNHKKYEIIWPRLLTLLFAGFVGLCGVSHLLDIVVLYRPIYWLQTIETGVTAFVSLLAAALLMALVVSHDHPKPEGPKRKETSA